MKFLFLGFLFISISCYSQSFSVCSWNLKDLGKSKSDEEINFIANTISKFDIVAVQEVVSGPDGSGAVARLTDQLNRMGNRWDYVISSPTSGALTSAERYAFLWKTSRVKKRGNAWLSVHYALEIDREPFFCRFSISNKIFTLVNYHSVSKSKRPESELKYFKFFPGLYANDNLIFCGDFNLPQSHSVFNPLRKLGYRPVLVGQKTTLRQRCIQYDCLASEFDNIFCRPNRVKILRKGFVEFYTVFADIKTARLISDHVPIFAEIE